MSAAWFRYRHYHPTEATDPATTFEAGRKVGRREILAETAQWAQLEPLLAQLLEELVDARIEREIESSDTREVPSS